MVIPEQDIETPRSSENARVLIEVDRLPTIDADPLQMRRLLQNLIGNALKFHREGEAPVVKICGRLLDGRGGHSDENSSGDRWCQLTVEDHGIGFDEKHMDRIFSMFERLHGRSAYEGTGVGLASLRAKHRKSIDNHFKSSFFLKSEEFNDTM